MASISASETCLSENKTKARWKMLRSAIVDKKLIGSGDFMSLQSVRSFNDFELFIRKQCNCVARPEKRPSNKNIYDTNCSWFSYTCKDIQRSKDVWIQHPSVKTTLKDLTSFNNTGNVCIWPAEEVLAYYCILHSDKFNCKSVVELGGGSSCLAGMCIALNSKSNKVLLTDGNVKCVESIKKTIEMNNQALKCSKVSACLLRWDKMSTYRKYGNAFDYVICADCIYFDQDRDMLADAIHYLLKPGGTALVFAPKRGKSMIQFVTICSDKFSKVTESHHYCQVVSNKHDQELLDNKQYNPDIHFPILVELFK